MTKKNIISMVHGSGGYQMQELIKNSILKNIDLKSAGSVSLDDLDDGSSILINNYINDNKKNMELIMTTDSHVIYPIFFPGGDIGRVAICGTVNDLAVMGAKPLALTCSLIIPEGFEIENLNRIMKSINDVSKDINVPIITGDTKTIEASSLNSIIINMTGLGICKKPIRNSGLEVGDKIIITGDIADHGISLLIKRQGFDFNTNLKSDVAPIWNMIEKILNFELDSKKRVISSMKDPTRGGLASALNEMAECSNVGIIIYESNLPIKKEVKTACEMLGLDPLEIANEGKAIIGVNTEYANDILNILKNTEFGKNSRIIGEVTEENKKKVILESEFGSQRYIDTPTGDPIPRVC